jgi:hypothetical protein
MPEPSLDAYATRRRLLAIRWIFPLQDRPPTVLPAHELVFGRSADSDVLLEGDKVSRKHAAIRREGTSCLIRDLDSRNGLFVDGARVAETALELGSLIRIGEWLGHVAEIDSDQAGLREDFHEVVPGHWAGPILWPALLSIRPAASTKVPILIEGRTGTGKEGVAKAVHAWSGRSGEFVAVNCAAIPDNLAEGEFFGYRKGAFTGAEKAHDGYFRAAHKGTLFLDEIADLPAALQPKLLRALEQGEVMPIGESKPVPVDVRVVAAVQAPLGEAVKKERFRPDLYARLDGVSVRLPPLCERVDEIPFLVNRLMERHLENRTTPRLETTLVEALCRYAWPYNVRELDRVVQQIVALHADKEVLSRGDLPEKLRVNLSADDSADNSAYRPSPETLLATLKKEGCNVRRAAQRLGLSRQQMYRLLESIPDFDLEDFRRTLGNRHERNDK